MRAVIIIGFFILSLPVYNYSSEGIPDTLVNKLDQLEGNKRLDMWRSWFYDFNPKEKDTWTEAYDQACDDAFSILPQDSAFHWCFDLKIILHNVHLNSGLKQESLEILKEAKIVVDSLTKLNDGYDLSLVKWYQAYGGFYYMNVDFDKAEEYYKKAIEINEVVGDDKTFFSLWQGLGLILSLNGKDKEAIEYYSRAESLLEPLGLPYSNFVSLNYYKAVLYKNMKDYETAHKHLEMIIDSVHLSYGPLVLRIKIDYANSLCITGKTQQSLRYYESIEAEVEKNSSIGNKLEYTGTLADCLIKAGQYEKASALNAKARELFEEDLETRRNEEVMEWQTKYDTQEKETKIQVLEQEKLINKSRFRMNLALIALAGLFGIGILGMFLLRAKNRRRQMALTLERDQQINEYRDRLFSSITHDIRTPLALMMAPLERAQGKINNTAVKSDIQLAQRNGKRLMELFNQILDWNRTEAKAMALNNQVGRLDITFDSLCDRFEQQAVENGIQFTKQLDVVNNQVLLDFDKVDKVLSNLIGNAIKFCSAEQEVSLKAKTIEQDGALMLLLEVHDEGPGIDVEDQKNIFNRFYQGKQGQLKGGTGIGLSLVHELVQIMKGKIELESAPGNGTTFRVTIPLQLAEDMQEELLDEPVQESTQEVTKKHGAEKPLVLVVEDEPELLEFLRSALTESYEVEIANSTTIGLSIAISRIPDIIISDWTLPDENGGWLCREIRKNPITAHIPIVILTAYSSEANQKEAFESGAVAWMNKPFKLEVLERQLQTILKQQYRAQKLWSKNVSSELENEDSAPAIDPFLQVVIDQIKANMSDEFYSVEKMAEDLHISRVQLFRKVRSLTGNSPSKMIKEYRLQKARKLLKTSKMTVAEIAYEIGFSDPNYFSTVYKQFFNISPTQEQRA